MLAILTIDFIVSAVGEWFIETISKQAGKIVTGHEKGLYNEYKLEKILRAEIKNATFNVELNDMTCEIINSNDTEIRFRRIHIQEK